MKRTLSLSVVLCLLAGFTACGSEDKKAEGPTPAQKRAAAEKRKKARSYATCQKTFEGLTKTLAELNSRLDVGLSYQEYSTEVGDIKVAYDSSGFEGLEGAGESECLLSVGLPLEAAMNQHFKASNTWSKCVEDIDCENDSIKPKLQRSWSAAATKVATSKTAMEELQP